MDFWRIQLQGGDKVTFYWENPPEDEADYSQHVLLFAPEVTDFTITDSGNPGCAVEGQRMCVHPVVDYSNGDIGKHKFTITAPFTGLGTLAVCTPNGGYYYYDECIGRYAEPSRFPYSFTAVAVHPACVEATRAYNAENAAYRSAQRHHRLHLARSLDKRVRTLRHAMQDACS